MTWPAYIREKAIELRIRKKLTIDEIAERLDISRTTIYYWVGDIPIPRTAKQSAAMVRRNQENVARWAARRQAAYDEGARMYSDLVHEPTFRDFVCLYIAEGFKRTRHVVSVANSDPSVIRAVKPWFERFAANPIRYSLQYHADQELELLMQGWAVELGIDGRAIKLQRKSNSNQLRGRQWRSRLGVLTITASDTYFRAKLQAWIDLIRTEWDDASNLSPPGRGAAW